MPPPSPFSFSSLYHRAQNKKGLTTGVFYVLRVLRSFVPVLQMFRSDLWVKIACYKFLSVYTSFFSSHKGTWYRERIEFSFRSIQFVFIQELDQRESLPFSYINMYDDDQ